MRITPLVALIVAILGLTGAAEKAHAGLFVSISVAPPALPVYVQPAIPGPGYMWTPGYWAWDDDEGDYYWVPGAWVPAPSPGLLWTPGYWGWNDGVYVWNAGYWGPHVGFYGGVVYGFGYGGVGFGGGRWVGGSFSYNRSVTNIGSSTSITNVYNQKIVVNNTTHVSFNGGNGGLQARPNAQELVAAREQHTPPTGDQMKHQQLASQNPELKRSRNNGRPTIAATRTAGDFSPRNVVAAKAAGSVRPAALRGTQTGNNQAGRGNNPALKRNTNANLNRNTNTNLNNSRLNKPNNPPKPPARPVVKRPPPKQIKKPG